MALDGTRHRIPHNSELVGLTIGIQIDDGTWRRFKVASVAKKREKKRKRVWLLQGCGVEASAPTVVLNKWRRRAGFDGSNFPFFVNGSIEVTTDELLEENHGDTWVQIIEKPEPVELPD